VSVYVFLGPSLPVAEARQQLEAVYLPPVAQGDVYHVTQRHPQAIGIVDGYFDRVPAVWHKEILWALSQGVLVFGGGSMGALRAAELAPFGMVGIGKIFAAYRDGVLRDDDEVAVAHASAEQGYRPLSEAMVNVRRTLGEAAAAGIISRPSLLALQRCAKETFYAERTYARLLDDAKTLVPPAELRALRGWLPQGRADQKHDDAVAVLRELRAAVTQDHPPTRVAFYFAYTEFWDRLRASTSAASDGESELALVLEELRLNEPAYRAARTAALVRLLGLEKAHRQGFAAAEDTLESEERLFAEGAGTATVAQLRSEQRLGDEHWQRLLHEEALLRRVTAAVEPHLTGSLVDHLKLSGAYSRLLKRAQHKRWALREQGYDDRALDDSAVSEARLWRWYCEERLGHAPSTDASTYAQRLGYADEASLRGAILREYLYTVRETGAVFQMRGSAEGSR
jgi:hypothetical protein